MPGISASRHLGVEATHHARHAPVDQRSGHADVQPPANAARNGQRDAAGARHVFQDPAGFLQERHPCGGELDMLAVAQQQLHAELFLQGLDGEAQWRLRDCEAVRGAPEVELLGQHGEVAKQVQLHPIHFKNISFKPENELDANDWRFHHCRRDVHVTNVQEATMCLFSRALAVLALVFASLASAQAYPSGPITMVVPFAAGSGTDAVARLVAKRLGERLQQPVLVDNRAGASAQIGALFVAKARPDGYTLFMTTNTSHSANPALFTKLKYDPIKDFTPISRVGELPFALLVNDGFPARSMKELLDYAKANPGKISYATPNSTSLVASETMKRIAGVDILGVPYKSSPQALTDVIGGQVQLYVADLGSSMPMIKSGSVRALAVTTRAAVKSLPGVPPLADSVPGFDLTSWNGIFGPPGMPRAIVDRLNAELATILAEKDLQEQLAAHGFEVWPSKSPDEFASYVAGQLAHWATLVKQAGIHPE
jgi:tripartite-type tricarboxylate transporter receptor subunit TctC